MDAMMTTNGDPLPLTSQPPFESGICSGVAEHEVRARLFSRFRRRSTHSMYDKGMHGMFGNVRKGMYDFAAAGSGRDRVRPRWAWPEVPTARADSLPIHTIRNRQFVDPDADACPHLATRQVTHVPCSPTLPSATTLSIQHTQGDHTVYTLICPHDTIRSLKAGG